MPRSHAGDVRLIALRDVLEEPGEYLVRKVCRWYSRHLRTPIADVYDLPWDDVLRHYFEGLYEEMGEAQVQEELQLMLESDVERDERERREEAGKARDVAGDAEFEQIVRERAKAQS